MTPAFINQIMFVTPAFNRDQALIQTCVYSRKYGTNNIYHPLCKYLRVPYGISSISEHYNRRMDEAFNGLSGFRCIVEDIVIYDNDVIQHESHVIRSFCNDVLITKLLSTPASSNMQNLKCSLQGSFCRQMDTEWILQSLMQLNNFLHQPIVQICVHSLDWSTYSRLAPIP